MMKRTFGILAAAVVLTQAALTAQAGEIVRIGEKCHGQSCAWYMAHVDAPIGWTANETMSLNTRALSLLPSKEKLEETDPLITVRTGLNGEVAAPELHGQGVERLADLPRADGKGVWTVYRIHNPARSGEEHELIALGEGGNGNGQRFSFAVALSASELDVVTHAKSAWRDVLAQLEGPALPVNVAAR